MGLEDPYDGPSHLRGRGACCPTKCLKTGMLEIAFPGILGHETQTLEE